MGITDYISRDPTFTAPPEEDEGELVIATIKELNILKNLNLLKTAVSILSTDVERNREQSQKHSSKSSHQPDRRPTHASRQLTQTRSETVKMIRKAINQPIRKSQRRRRFLRIKDLIHSHLLPSFKSDSNLQLSPNSHNITTMQSDKNSSSSRQPIDSEVESHQSRVIQDLDAHIPITQAQIAHLKKAGGIRFVGDRAEVYRPNKSARAEIRDLQDRLDKLYATRRKAKSLDRHRPSKSFKNRRPIRCKQSRPDSQAAKLSRRKTSPPLSLKSC